VKFPDDIRVLVEQKFGSTIQYPKDCEGLSRDLKIRIKVNVSPSTLKRLFGFVAGIETPRKYTLDAIANYLGFDGWEKVLDYRTNKSNSSFFSVQGIESKNLKKGTMISFTYEPNRQVKLLYTGNDRFKVLESKNSKLRENDILTFSFMVLGNTFIANNVIRSKKMLGRFNAGKVNGITSITVLN
jgi:hypothetical protein